MKPPLIDTWDDAMLFASAVRMEIYAVDDCDGAHERARALKAIDHLETLLAKVKDRLKEKPAA